MWRRFHRSTRRLHQNTTLPYHRSTWCTITDFGAVRFVNFTRSCKVLKLVLCLPKGFSRELKGDSVEMSSVEEPDTRGELRERKRQNRRKMRVTGRGVRLLLDILRWRAQRMKGDAKEE